MNYASVCSGVESASLAWDALGWNPVWFSEIEAFPSAVLAARFPNVPNLGDMTKIKGEEYDGAVDLLVGGTPCQGFSVAGRQGGLDDPRSVLCLTYVGLLKTMRPRWFVWENVPGVFSTADGEDFRSFIRAIDEIGYSCAWRVLDAQYVRVDGYPRAVPQRRRRVFVVGHSSGDWRYPASVLFEPDSVQRDTPPRGIKGQGFAGDAEKRIGTASGRLWDSSGTNPTLNQSSAGSGIIGQSNQELFSQNANGLVMSIGNGQVEAAMRPNQEFSNTIHCMHDHEIILDGRDVVCLNDQGGSMMKIEKDATVGTLRANTHGNEPIICAGFMGGQGSKAGGIAYSEEVSPTVKASPSGGNQVPDVVFGCMTKRQSMTVTEGVMECIIASDYKEPGIICVHGSQDPITNTDHANAVNRNNGLENCVCYESRAVAIAENIIGRKVENGGNGIGAQEELAYTQNTCGVMGVSANATVRRLTPIECERLMGFPDNWTRIPWKNKPEEDCPDSPRYKACGNSMCVNVMRWIGMRIEMVERKIKETE